MSIGKSWKQQPLYKAPIRTTPGESTNWRLLQHNDHLLAQNRKLRIANWLLSCVSSRSSSFC